MPRPQTRLIITVTLDTTVVISQTIFRANLLPSTEETKPNRTKANNTRTKWQKAQPKPNPKL